MRGLVSDVIGRMSSILHMNNGAASKGLPAPAGITSYPRRKKPFLENMLSKSNPFYTIFPEIRTQCTALFRVDSPQQHHITLLDRLDIPFFSPSHLHLLRHPTHLSENLFQPPHTFFPSYSSHKSRR